MALSSLILVVIAVAALVALVVTVVRIVRKDGYGAPGPDLRYTWFAPLEPR